MGSDISEKMFSLMQKHLEYGTPIKDMAMSPIQKQRALVCLDVYKKIQDNPYMDVRKYIRNKYGRSETEIRQDKKIIDFLVGELNQDTKAISQYRIRSAAEKAMRIGDATGDWKASLEGAKMLYKVEGLDKPETAIDIEQCTPGLQTVLVSAPKGKQEYSPEMLDKLRKKYNAEKDKTQEMVEAKLGLFVQAGSSVEEEFNLPSVMEMPIPEEEVNMFDEDDPDDNGE